MKDQKIKQLQDSALRDFIEGLLEDCPPEDRIHDEIIVHVGRMEGQGVQPQTMPRNPMRPIIYPIIEILTDDGDILSYNDPYSGPFERMGEAIDDAARDGGMVILEDPQYKKDLQAEFVSLVETFTCGEGFNSYTHRLCCIEAVLDMWDLLEAWDMPVMSESKLTAITGDF